MARTASLLTSDELLVIEDITNGTYFTYDETPSGAQNGVNLVFTLIASPVPAASLVLTKNGQTLMAGGVDYTLSGSMITYVAAQVPFAEDVIKANYVTSPV